MMSKEDMVEELLAINDDSHRRMKEALLLLKETDDLELIYEKLGEHGPVIKQNNIRHKGLIREIFYMIKKGQGVNRENDQ